MELEVIVREYQTKDRETVLDLVREFASEMYHKFKDEIPGMKERDESEVVEQEVEHRKIYLEPETKYKVWVAAVDDRIVGYIVGYPYSGFGEHGAAHKLSPAILAKSTSFMIDFTFVSKEYRNKGISKQLQSVLIDYAIEKRKKEVVARVAKWNESAIAAYKSLGFKKEDEDRTYLFSLEL